MVDNAPYREEEVRRLLAQCDLLEAHTVLLVTRMPSQLPMPMIELPPPAREEIDQVGRFVGHLGYFLDASRLPDTPTFWNVLLAST